MRRLTVPMTGNASQEAISLVSNLSLDPALQALAWLYIDELERAHDVCQSMGDKTGAAIHAIVHRREGDFYNALYWWDRAEDHPALAGQDPVELTKAIQRGDISDRTVDLHRAEWASLAAWCAA